MKRLLRWWEDVLSESDFPVMFLYIMFSAILWNITILLIVLGWVKWVGP